MTITQEAQLDRKETLKNLNRKKSCPLIEYGNPDKTVVVRLLPPTLEETEFLNQVNKSSPSFQHGCENMAYKQGAKALHYFEEPSFSLASVRFTSRELAELFRKEIHQILFKEAKTGDSIKCTTMKPLFGELSPGPALRNDDQLNNEVFKLFAELRGKKEGHADINEAVASVKSTLKHRKTKLKYLKKKFEKGVSQATRKSTSSSGKAQSNVPSRKKDRGRETIKEQDTKIQFDQTVREITQEGTPKKKKNKKLNFQIDNGSDSRSKLQAKPSSQVAPESKSPKKKQKKKKERKKQALGADNDVDEKS